VGGQRYYIQYLYREGGGGDYGQVAVKLTSDPTDPNSLTTISGNQIASLFDSTGASVTITQQPVNQSFEGTITTFTPDFNANGAGLYVTIPAGQTYTGVWHHVVSTGAWEENGEELETGHANTSILNTPALVVKADGTVTLSFDHRWSREDGGGNWDGNQLRVSVNGGGFTTVPGSAFTLNGYNGAVAGNSSSILHGQEAFIGTSPGFAAGPITSTANLGTFTAGDVLRIQFVAASDGNTAGPSQPNWEITSMGSAEVDAYPGNAANTVTFTVGATGQNALGPNQPLTYQWSRDNGSGFVVIPGATSQSYTIAPAPSDNGARFRVNVAVAGANLDSAAATLTVGTPVTLNITRSGSQVTVSWSGSCTLQEAGAIDNTGTGWGPSAVVNGVPFTPTGGQRYFRLICP